jgi:antitoxin ParD1/3/4
MSTMNISLPESMKSFVDEQVERKGYGSSSEYIRDLLRKEQDREKLHAMILEGIASGRSGVAADKAYFDGLRERVRRQATQPPAAPKLVRRS